MSLNRMLDAAHKEWHGVKLHQPDWRDCSYSVALGAELRREDLACHLILNAYWEPLDFELPQPQRGGSWRRWIDTALDSPEDIVPFQKAPAVGGPTYRAGARSVVVLFMHVGSGK
jgi:glycogen operon protein